MNNINKMICLCSVLIAYSTTSLKAQLLMKDDFQSASDYWYWREDGNQSKPTVHDGMLHLQLVNAIDSEYCNTEIYDPTKPYAPGTQTRIRLKTSPIHTGSRGWGFWDGSLSSVPTDFDVAWVMQQGSNNIGNDYNWFTFGSNNANLIDWQGFSLDNIIDETKWQTYKIVWELNKVLFYVEDNLLFETSEFIPNQNMRMDIWVDNRVINLGEPTDFFNNNVEFSEMLVDFVEISGSEGPSITRETNGNVLFWDSPNSFPNGNKNHLWKQYEFHSENDSDALLFITGSAEKYTNSEGSDDLKVIFDNYDYGWRNRHSLDGKILNGAGKSIVLPIQLMEGTHKIDLYTEITPFLKDVIILSNLNSEPILIRDFNEAAEDKKGLWKTIDFNISGPNETTLIISGTAIQNQALRIAVDNTNYGWTGDQSIDGNELDGTPKTVVINELLEDGPHQLKIFNNGKAELYSVAIYGSSNITDISNIQKAEKDLIFRANPNPFNNSTVINYITNHNSNNRITIYNTLGQQIDILLDEFQNAGEYQLSWNPINQTSGIYICTLESDNFFKVEKLILLK